jgi:hypothetical protein
MLLMNYEYPYFELYCLLALIEAISFMKKFFTGLFVFLFSFGVLLIVRKIMTEKEITGKQVVKFILITSYVTVGVLFLLTMIFKS